MDPKCFASSYERIDYFHSAIHNAKRFSAASLNGCSGLLNIFLFNRNPKSQKLLVTGLDSHILIVLCQHLSSMLICPLQCHQDIKNAV